MSGSLIGRWTVTSFQEAPEGSYFHGTGTELFKGCLDRRRDHRRKHDPNGTLSFTFDYWALFGPDDPESLVRGACFQPVVSGTGDFDGAQGVLSMADTPTKDGVSTRYVGSLTLGSRYSSPARAARANAC